VGAGVPEAAAVNVAEPPILAETPCGCVVKLGGLVVVPAVIVNTQVALTEFPLVFAFSHAFTVTVQLPCVVGVPAMVILYGELTLIGFPPVTLSPVGKVPVTLHERGLPGAPDNEKLTLIAVPEVPLTVNCVPAGPLLGEAGVTLKVVAPATELYAPNAAIAKTDFITTPLPPLSNRLPACTNSLSTGMRCNKSTNIIDGTCTQRKRK
jgi:hypothetical protein